MDGSQGPLKRPNKKAETHPPANPFRMILMLGMMIFVVVLLSRGTNTSAGQGDPVPADYKPLRAQPPRVVDDGLGTLIIFPPTMEYRPEAVDEAMKKAKDEWKKQHPERVVVAVLNNVNGPADSGYRWVIFYEVR